MSKLTGRDEVVCDGVVYTIAGTFGFLGELQDELEKLPIIKKLAIESNRLIDCSLAYNLIAGGSMDIELLKAVVACGIEFENGEKMPKQKREQAAEKIIEAKGVEAAYSMAHFLLSGAMIGDEKKRELKEQQNRIKQAIMETSNLKSWTFKEVGTLLAVMLVPSIVAVCASFSLLKMLT